MTKYTVTGPVAFMEYEPGEEFDEDLDPELEARALERGSISKGSHPRKKKEDGNAEADSAN